jgi:hypothetical protein
LDLGFPNSPNQRHSLARFFTDLVLLIQSCESANLVEEVLRGVSQGFLRRREWKASDDRCRVYLLSIARKGYARLAVNGAIF